MAFGKKKASAGIDAAVNKAANFEITVSDLARRSEKRAWWVAGLSLLLTLVMAGILAYMVPLKKEVPYLVMVDPYAGIARLARVTGDDGYQSVIAKEAISRANIASYILARESYDSGLINERDYRTVYTMSEPDVWSAYSASRDPRNPESPATMYGARTAIRVKITSVTPLGARPGKPPTGATVRYQRQLYEKSNGATRVLDSRIATMEFAYRPELKMDREDDNMVNPLRFRVINYRSDLDSATPVPVEFPAAIPAQPGAMPAPAATNAAASAPPATTAPVNPQAIPASPQATASPTTPASPAQGVH
ncbi:virB8 family protein [Solilutibacter silvestris]|uniref:Type IV secretory pathway component VirB8 n=1 Tax=Solilutibacter silvestris TaxID=1645665 RepID=A0A2K1PYP9_9GAMM|nr:type IV secretion system protein [Lysobacter silvestris]PNS07922.1 Type IV secretory pathway component VirB8 [Lysobacter silvestris]